MIVDNPVSEDNLAATVTYYTLSTFNYSVAIVSIDHDIYVPAIVYYSHDMDR